MLNSRTLKLNKKLNLKDYLRKKTENDRQYEEYVNNVIANAHESIRNGKVRPIKYLIQEIKEKYGLMPK